jgi:hypothetical protein
MRSNHAGGGGNRLRWIALVAIFTLVVLPSFDGSGRGGLFGLATLGFIGWIGWRLIRAGLAGEPSGQPAPTALGSDGALDTAEGPDREAVATPRARPLGAPPTATAATAENPAATGLTEDAQAPGDASDLSALEWRLAELASLRDGGVITPAEYEAKRAEAIRRF